MLAYTFYENDGRVMRYAETLVREGWTVDAIVLRRDLQPEQEIINGVNVFRIQKRIKNESGKLSYLNRILKFLFHSMFEITRRHLKEPYDLIHVHSVPDFEVFAAFVAKLKGAKIILDIHDIVPEFYAAKFNVREDSLIFSALKLIEKLSASFANHVIIANDLWLDKITARSINRNKCSSFINYPDLSIFHPGLRTRNADGKFIILYPGTLNWHQGLDLAVKAVALAQQEAPSIELHIIGEGSAKPELYKLVEELHLNDKVFISSSVPLREIALVMANADLGIVPKRNDSFGGDAFSTKILEFMALGVPLVVADTRIDKYYFNESLLMYFKSGDEKDLARVMVDTYHNREQNSQLAARALEYARDNSWGGKSGEYMAIVNELVNGPHTGALGKCA
jgi:glycosyltransferase involved in cell wall biosynthesis